MTSPLAAMPILSPPDPQARYLSNSLPHFLATNSLLDLSPATKWVLVLQPPARDSNRISELTQIQLIFQFRDLITIPVSNKFFLPDNSLMQYFSSCWQACDSPISPSLQMLLGPSQTQQVNSLSLLQNDSVQMLELVTGSLDFASITFTAGSWPRSKLFFLVYKQFLKYCLASYNVRKTFKVKWIIVFVRPVFSK